MRLPPLLSLGPWIQTGPDSGIHNGMGGRGAGQKDKDHDQKNLEAGQHGAQREMMKVKEGKGYQSQQQTHRVEFTGRMQPRVKIRKPEDPYGTTRKEKQPGKQKQAYDNIHFSQLRGLSFIQAKGFTWLYVAQAIFGLNPTKLNLSVRCFVVQPLALLKVSRSRKHCEKIEHGVSQGYIHEHLHPMEDESD
jgi:hypothetical protein